jgi:hypothetical protein
MSEINLVSVKAAAKREFGSVPGVQGFGIGADSLRIYVQNPGVRAHMPSSFQGVPVQYVVVGDVVAG